MGTAGNRERGEPELGEELGLRKHRLRDSMAAVVSDVMVAGQYEEEGIVLQAVA